MAIRIEPYDSEAQAEAALAFNPRLRAHHRTESLLSGQPPEAKAPNAAIRELSMNTHTGKGFTSEGKLDRGFCSLMTRLSKIQRWFATASDTLGQAEAARTSSQGVLLSEQPPAAKAPNAAIRELSMYTHTGKGLIGDGKLDSGFSV